MQRDSLFSSEEVNSSCGFYLGNLAGFLKPSGFLFQSFFDEGSQFSCGFIHLFDVLAFDHDTHQRFCAGSADQHAAILREFCFQFFDAFANHFIVNVVVLFRVV